MILCRTPPPIFLPRNRTFYDVIHHNQHHSGSLDYLRWLRPRTPSQRRRLRCAQHQNYQNLFDKYAKPAGPRLYHHNCALWSLAVDQSVQDLTDCLYKAGVAWKDVWCTGDTNATATATSYPTATATGASSSKDGKGTTGSLTSEAATATESSMAFSLRGHVSNKVALGLLGLVVIEAMGWF
ncbi:hypothetical protein BDV23DRAFT_184806 [Aspergillus alliaceus]|uniref:Uncharacterized protein n=1 Tax=Petromyces alliaceus TaxID=209559 RepID=A0A5N7C4W6_PETAA|nr:hypothetical protein BDV23DRAFT_184806 [Aspergillus alliaceus]